MSVKSESTDRVERIRRALRVAATLSLAVSAGLLIVMAAAETPSMLRGQALMTFVGLAVGAFLVNVQLASWGARKGLVAAGLASVAVSQACFWLLVWTGWKTHTLLWRCWWLSMVPSITITHVLALWRAETVDRRLRWATIVCAIASAAIIAALGLREELLADLHRAWLIVAAVPFAGSIVGSGAVLAGHLRGRLRRPPMSLRAKAAWLIATHAALFALGWYVGRRAGPAPPGEMPPSSIALLSSEQIDRQIADDLERLKIVADGLEQLQSESEAFQAALRQEMSDQGRSVYTPEEDDALRWRFVSYLSYRAALMRIVAAYSGFQAVRDPARRVRCFMLGHAAAAVACRSGLRLVKLHQAYPAERRKLNEAEPSWGIPAGMFDLILAHCASEAAAESLMETSAYYRTRRAAWRQQAVWATEDFDWLDGRIDSAIAYAADNPLSPSRARLELFLSRVGQDAYSPVYAVQTMVATWMGDTRIVDRPPMVTTGQIGKLAAQLRPGDILLERRNWFVSNAFLPGFWPHAAIYVGTIDDLRRMGIADDDDVRAKMDAYLAPAADGEPCTVIEAVSEGVIFNSLTHSMHADYVAVLRPRLSQEHIARAIVRAFRHHGKPYDFAFDFFTSDRLVCTELVYRSYDGLLHFKLTRVMGRETLPAVEIARKFADERDREDRELDFVLFLDAAPQRGRAEPADVETFCGSVDRPRSFNE